MLSIKNDNISVSINEFGGTMCSIKKDGVEYQWQGSKDSWEGQDVAIFPFVARLKDGYYLVDNKKYELKIHGLIRYANLNVEYHKENEVQLSFKWSNETLALYPFKFEYYITYKIENNIINVIYTVKNVDDKPIYFGLGGHPAFAIPAERVRGIDDISGNSIIFEKPLNLANYTLEESGCFISGKESLGVIDKIELTKALFEKYKTLMLTGDAFSKVSLKRKDGIIINLDISDYPILALWTKETYGAYICIEPWTSIPDMNYPNRELKDKPTIQMLNAKDVKEYKYSITI